MGFTKKDEGLLLTGLLLGILGNIVANGIWEWSALTGATDFRIPVLIISLMGTGTLIYLLWPQVKKW